MATALSVVNNVIDFLSSVSTKLGLDVLFIIGLLVEVLFVLFFVIKSSFSYEVSLNRALDKINYWLFQKKTVNEENIRELNNIFKTKAPKRLCYYWHQYVLFREGNPSYYFTVNNLIDQPTKTSSFVSDIRNLSVFTVFWAILSATFIFISQSYEASAVAGKALVMALLLGLLITLIGGLFVMYLRTRKKSVLNALDQNVRLFDRFMDNACIDLPSYIDYQILFTPNEIEKGQPVLREFLDFKARKEKEDFIKAREEDIDYVTYDFTSTGVDGSIVLDRAMRESELFLKKRDKILVQISQLEAELESRKKNFDNVQRESQTKIQASKENIIRLRQMQEETTNRIESNYYRKQQTQEAAKQEQLEQEFDQQRAKYLLEKGECEEEIAKLNDELEGYRKNVENAMLGEYKTFYDKFCHSAEKVVAKVFGEKFDELKAENENYKQKITELELKLKNVPAQVTSNENSDTQATDEGHYDEKGNYVYSNGTYYDPEGNFHDNEGNVYSQDGQLISKALEKTEVKEDKKQVVNFDDFDTFDFMTDVAQKDDVYNVAENVVNQLDKDDEIEVVNNSKPSANEQEPVQETTVEDNIVNEEVAQENDDALEAEDEIDKEELDKEQGLEDFELEKDEEIEQPKRKAGRPRKVQTANVVSAPKRKVGRPKKTVSTVSEQPKRKVGRPKKVQTSSTVSEPKRKVGRPKKIVKIEEQKKNGRGRPRKNSAETINEINKKLSEEETRFLSGRKDLNKELELALNGTNQSNSQDRRVELLKEIEKLQEEARNVIGSNQSESKIQELNERIENLLNEIKNS